MNKWESLCWKSIECKRRKMKEKSDRKFSEWGASRLKHETRLSQIDFRIRSVVLLLRDFPELAFFSFPTQRQALPHAYCRRFRTERSMKCGRWNFTILVRWSLFASYSFPPTPAVAVSRLSSQLLFSSKCIKQLKSKCFSYFCSPLFYSRVRLETIMRWGKKIPEHNKKWKRLIIEETFLFLGNKSQEFRNFTRKCSVANRRDGPWSVSATLCNPIRALI